MGKILTGSFQHTTFEWLGTYRHLLWQIVCCSPTAVPWQNKPNQHLNISRIQQKEIQLIKT